MTNNKKILENTGFIIIMLIFVFPFGLYLMWKNQKFKPKTRIIITILILLILVIPKPAQEKQENEIQTTKIAKETSQVNKPISQQSDNKSIDNQASETPVNDINIDYAIKKIDDVSVSEKVIRKDIHVVIPQTDLLLKEDFEKLCQKIVKDYTESNPVNALTVYFYNNDAEIGSGYTVGMSTYYPGGEIGNATDVTTGDYSTFQYSYTFNEKSDTNKPTEKEIEIYEYYNSLLNANYEYPTPSAQEMATYFELDVDEINRNFNAYESSYNDWRHEKECDENTAAHFGITLDDVTQIWAKVYSYKDF